jgi:hypothetical protein
MPAALHDAAPPIVAPIRRRLPRRDRGIDEPGVPPGARRADAGFARPRQAAEARAPAAVRDPRHFLLLPFLPLPARLIVLLPASLAMVALAERAPVALGENA